MPNTVTISKSFARKVTVPFEFGSTEVPEVIHITPRVFKDDRGFFAETFKGTDFSQVGLTEVKQVNHSKSTRGVLRGLHYQLNPKAQGKLVTVVEGSIFDVAVDIRKGSSTFGKWVGRELNADEKNMLYVPVGFAHGFCVTSDIAQVIYYCSEEYSPQHEQGIMYNDPQIAVEWPVDEPDLSDRDKNHPLLSKAKNNFIYGEDA